MFPKYRHVYFACESATDFTKPGMTTPTTSLLKGVFLHMEIASCCTYPSVTSQTRQGTFMSQIMVFDPFRKGFYDAFLLRERTRIFIPTTNSLLEAVNSESKQEGWGHW